MLPGHERIERLCRVVAVRCANRHHVDIVTAEQGTIVGMPRHIREARRDRLVAMPPGHGHNARLRALFERHGVYLADAPEPHDADTDWASALPFAVALMHRVRTHRG